MLTPTQRKLLLFIEREIDEKGRVPSNREMASRFDYCTKGNASGSIHRLLQCLQDRGHVRLYYGQVRSIVVIKPISRFAAFKFNDSTKELEPNGCFEPGAAGGQSLRSKCVRKG